MIKCSNEDVRWIDTSKYLYKLFITMVDGNQFIVDSLTLLNGNITMYGVKDAS